MFNHKNQKKIAYDEKIKAKKHQRRGHKINHYSF